MASAGLSIGDFSRMTHLSVKALRHYHDVGPARTRVEVDHISGYRYYETGARSRLAQVIRRFRDLGMPLDQSVKSVLEAPDVPARNKAIVAHLGPDAEPSWPAPRPPSPGWRRCSKGPPHRLAVIGFRTIPDVFRRGGHPPGRGCASSRPVWMDKSRSTSYTTDHRRRPGRTEAGPPGGALYPGEFFELDRAEVTAFVPVQAFIGAGLSRPPPGRNSRVEPLRVPGGQFAVAVHEAPAPTTSTGPTAPSAPW